MSNQFDNFKLPTNAYVAFDALSLRDLIINRLNTQAIFTDQNYQGSNISSIIDIIAYSYHVLMFYMNQTSSESNFSTATLFENVNKIVKILNYKPIGNQTAILSFKAIADAQLTPGVYTIPRYSYFTLNGINYSFNKDATLSVPLTGGELTTLEDNNTLYQGTYREYPLYSAQGAPFESFTLVLVDPNGTNMAIDHFNIDVYVKDNTQLTPVWVKWSPTLSLFLEQPDAKKYEIRLNENGRYEIKFGNNVTGNQLHEGDSVAVYYLQSDKAAGEVGTGALDGNRLYYYNSSQLNSIIYNEISSDINMLDVDKTSLITFSNIYASTKYTERESVESIKTNALNSFQSQYRLLTTSDIANFIKANYSNIIGSVRAVNNTDYIAGHIDYLFSLGIDNPNTDSRIQINQLKFSSACNFNNIYIYTSPNIFTETSLTTRTNYINAAQKQLIINSLAPYKIATSNIVIMDPVYMCVDIGVTDINETPSIEASNETTLRIIIENNISSLQIQQQVAKIFKDYFLTTKDNLGSLINISDISTSILNIGGIKTIQTIRGDIVKSGISLLIYNPVYPDIDIKVTQQNHQLGYFQFPYLNNPLEFINKIEVVTK